MLEKEVPGMRAAKYVWISSFPALSPYRF